MTITVSADVNDNFDYAALNVSATISREAAGAIAHAVAAVNGMEARGLLHPR